jgi:hypothetical protein
MEIPLMVLQLLYNPYGSKIGTLFRNRIKAYDALIKLRLSTGDIIG